MANIPVLKVPVVLLTILTSMATAQAAAPLSEQQARLAAAGFVKGFGFGPNGGQIVAVPDKPAAGETIEEIAGHLQRAFLVVRGETGYCGPIREATWIFIWDTQESASWSGGYPVMVNARTGKVLDCRS